MAVDFAKGLDLQRTDEGDGNVDPGISLTAVGTEAKGEKPDFQEQNALSPMEVVPTVPYSADLLGQKYAAGKGQNWQEVVKGLPQISVGQVEA